MKGVFIFGLFSRDEKIRKALKEFSKNKIKKEDLNKIYKEKAKKLIEFQREGKFSFIYDGMLRWQDLLRPFTKYQGIEEGTLIRWFEENFFYKIPRIISKIELKNYILKDFVEIEILKNIPNSSISIPDPLTFIYLSENNYYKNYEEFFFDFSYNLLKDISYLVNNLNLKLIQLLSPYLGYYGIKKEDIQLLSYFINELKKFNLKVSLNLYFIKDYKILVSIKDLNIDILAIDLCYSYREKFLNYAKYANFNYALGLIDSRISLMEDVQYIIKEFNKIQSRLNSNKEIYLINSSDFDLLPYEIALGKLKVMKEICKLISKKDE